MELLGGKLLLLDLVHHQSGDAGHVAAAESHLDGREADVAEQRLQVGFRELLGRDAEAERIDPCVEDFERLGVGLRGAADREGLVHEPAIVAARAAHIGKFACFGTQEPDAFEVFGTVVRPDIEALARSPHQFTFVVRSLEVGSDRRLPLLGRNRREFGEQLFTLGICHNYLEISNRLFQNCS